MVNFTAATENSYTGLNSIFPHTNEAGIINPTLAKES